MSCSIDSKYFINTNFKSTITTYKFTLRVRSRASTANAQFCVLSVEVSIIDERPHKLNLYLLVIELKKKLRCISLPPPKRTPLHDVFNAVLSVAEFGSRDPQMTHSVENKQF